MFSAVPCSGRGSPAGFEFDPVRPFGERDIRTIYSTVHQIAFRDVQQVFKLSPDCNDYEVMAACDSLIGKYATEQEYDNACIALLQSKGWI